MIEIRIEQSNDKEKYAINFDKAVKRFKKICSDDGFIKENRDRQYYKKPSEKNREERRRNLRLFEKLKQGYNE